MDAQRAMLDALMGLDRNADAGKKKAKVGERFLDEGVCKHYLIGLCPKLILTNTKRDAGACKLQHADNFVEEFRAHERKEELTQKYERGLYAELKDILVQAERWKEREIGNLKRVQAKTPAEILAATGKDKDVQVMRDSAAALMEEASKLAEEGQLEESQKKMEAAKQQTAQADAAVEAITQIKDESVCQICGVRFEQSREANMANSHAAGRLHQAYVEMHAKLKELEERMKVMPKQDDADRKRDRDRDRAGDRDRDRERDRRDDRDRRDRSRDRRDRDRDRERDRERDRDRRDRR